MTFCILHQWTFPVHLHSPFRSLPKTVAGKFSGLDGSAFTNADPSVAHPRLPSVRRQKDQIRSCNTFAHVFDLKAAFFQLPLAPCIRKYFWFTSQGLHYQYAVLPMGFSLSVGILQPILEALAEACCESPTPGSVNFIAYVDNIRFCSTDPSLLTQSTSLFEELCKEFSVTLGPPPDPNIFLGVHYDYTLATCSLSADSIYKCSSALRNLFTSPCLATLQKAFGHLLWASTVLELSLCDYFFLIKFYSRRSAMYATTPDLPFPIWPSITPDLLHWMRAIETNTPVRLTPLPSSTISWALVTDASSSGYGCVWLSSSGHIVWSSGLWTDSELLLHINCKEMRSITYALANFPTAYNPSDPLHIFTDSTSAHGALRRHHSPSWGVTSELRRLLPLVTPLMTFSWLPSRSNVADAPSRGRCPSPSAIAGFFASDTLADRMGCMGDTED